MKNKSSRRRRVRKQKPAQQNTQSENFFESQVQRKCDKCEDDEKKGVQKKSDGQAAAKSNFFGHYMKNINSKGSAIPKQKRNFFEAKMNDNFGNVQVHNDQEAANAAKEIGAKAFTWQNHVVLNTERLKSDSLEEKQVFAHELKHVQQQRNGKQIIQMLAEEDTKAPNKEEETDEAINENTPATDAKAMEKEAELQEDRIMVPERVPDIHYSGQPSSKTVFGNSISLEAVTNASYDGGNGRTTSLERTPTTEGLGCTEGDCWHYTGGYEINYHVTTSVSLPSIPDGLTNCQEERVRNAISNELAPHEQEHVAAFEQYNGSVTLSIDYTGPSTGIEAYVQQLHNADEQARMAAANAASAALDPFHVPVDLECEEPSEVAPDTPPEE